MSTETDRLRLLLEAIGLDSDAATLRAGQIRALQVRGLALGQRAVRLLEEMAERAATAETDTPDPVDPDRETLSPQELFTLISEAEAQQAAGETLEVARSDNQAVDAASSGTEPTLQQDEGLSESPRERHSDQLLDPGERVDQYEIVRAVGQGGMGAVYLARDALLGRKVAIKVVHPHLVASAGAVERFLFEARATARFNHPNIVTIYGLGQVRGCPYVALEYLPGISLRVRLRHGRLATGEAVLVARRVAQALAEAHRQSILHCDLKPENIFLPRDGRLRVLDFGLSRLVHRPPLQPLDTLREEDNIPTAALDNQEHHSALRGTAPYMAPEQWRQEELGPATDIWAFGVTLFEALCGERPYQGSPVAIYEQVTDEERPTPSPLALDPKLPRALALLCERCLHRDPTQRPSASAIADELSLHSGGRARTQEDEDKSPFRGLMPFRRAHADLFFGRDPESAAFVERLREAALVAVVGPSGAGKSSFVQAGVVPRLEQLGPWDPIVLRPGATPLLAIAGRLLQETTSTESAPALPDPGQVQTRRELAQELRDSPAQLGRLLRERAHRTSGNVILVVDQFEELFTLVEDPEERAAFCQALLFAADDPDGPVRVVLTLREDFLGRLAVFPEFVAEVARGIVVIRTPGPTALHDTLTRPLARRGYRFEDDELVGEMVAEVAQEQSGLPLLQFAAQRLWEGRDRDRKVLCRSTYEAIGGVAGALAEHADQVLSGLVGDAARAAPEVLVSLVTPDGTRATAQEDRLIAQVGAGAAEAVAHLVAARLVASRRALAGDRSVSLLELVHESLINRWEQLRRWREESLEDVNLQADLQAAVEQWKRRGRRAEDLWRGLSLAEAIDWRERRSDPLPEELEQFITRSAREARAQSVRLARLRFGLVGGLLLFGLAVAAFMWIRAKERRAQQARSEALAARAKARSRLSLALLEGAQAALLRRAFAESRAKLRASFEVSDSVGARALFATLRNRQLKFRAQHPESVFSVAAAPDGSLVATGAYDGTIRLWDWTTGAVRVLRGHRKEVFSLAFGPHGRRLASGAGDGNVRLWDLRTGRSRILTGHLDRVYGVAFDPTGNRVASASGDATIKIWSLSRKGVTTLRGHNGRVNAVSFAPSGDRLFSGGEDRTVRVWDLRRGTSRALTGHTDSVVTVASKPSGAGLASGSEDGTVRVWNLDRNEHRVLRGHRGAVTCLAFDPRGDSIASGGTDRTVRLRNLRNGETRLLGFHADQVSSLGFSGSGRLLASGSYDRTMKLWDLRTPPRRFASGHEGWVSGVAFSPDGEQLASASQDRTVRLWNLRTGQSSPLKGHTARVIEVAYRSDGRQLASASWDQTVRLWDLRTGSSRVLRGHTGRIYGLSYAPDGRHIASGSWDRTIRIWNVASGEARVFRGHTGRVFGVAYAPDGRHIASAAWDRTVRLWDVETGKARVLRGHTHRVSAVAFAPSGAFIASASYDTTVRLWDRSTGKARVLRGSTDYLWGVAISPDSKKVAAASRDRRIRVWDVASGKLLLALSGHSMDVNRVTFGPHGNLLASGSDDTTVRLWELPEGRPRWRAPLLLGGERPRLITGRGLITLQGFGTRGAPLGKPTDPEEARLITAIHRGVLHAALSQDGGRVALVPQRDRVELWDVRRGIRRWSTRWPGIEKVVPFAGGVAGLARGSVSLVLGPGKVKQTLVPSGAGVIALSRGRLLVATRSAVHELDPQGRPAGKTAVDPGVTAMMLTAELLILGHRDGTIELAPRARRGKLRHRPLENTPARPVTHLAEGPQGTLAVGFQDGTAGLWNRNTGTLLARRRLHGPVHLLRRIGRRLYVATELADTASIDLTIFHQDDCSVMRRIWAAFPATWDRGRAVRRPRPRKHRCLSKPDP
ncbi:MAG: protein kinase [bacterium]